MTVHLIPVWMWLIIGLCCAATCHAAFATLLHGGRRTAVPLRSDDCTSANPVAPVSILKPLCGAEPRLYANLQTFCAQTHPSYQLLFGVAHASDAAASVVRRLARAYPERDIELVIDATAHGSNRKVANLINLSRHAKHDVIVIADSDISVEPDYLMRVTAPLADPGVGVVTCLYRARCVGGIWARLGGLFIDEWFAPSVYVANALGYGRFGFGATLALTRETLQKIGGLEALRDCLADDSGSPSALASSTCARCCPMSSSRPMSSKTISLRCGGARRAGCAPSVRLIPWVSLSCALRLHRRGF